MQTNILNGEEKKTNLYIIGAKDKLFGLAVARQLCCVHNHRPAH